MKPDWLMDWLMDQFSALVPNGTQGSGTHFQHPDQPLSATALPQTHPLKTRIAALLQALHFMRDWQVNPFYRGFRHLSFHFLVSWDLDFPPAPGGRTHHGGGKPHNKGLFEKGMSPHSRRSHPAAISRFTMFCKLLAVLATATAIQYTKEQLANEITDLPGVPAGKLSHCLSCS
jgi:hypothetical protein